MRILRVAQKCYPDVTGGGAYHVHAMSRDQAAMGHDVTVLTIGDSPSTESRDGYRVRRCQSLAAPLGNDIAPGIWPALRKETYDIVHAHSHLYASTNLAALSRRLGGPPLAITNHGLYSQTAPKRIFDAYVRTIGQWTFNSADIVFCYTEADRERLRSVGVSAPTAVVSNGIDTDRFSPDGQASDRLGSDGPAVLFVGRLVEGKRPMDALEAVQRLRDSWPDLTLYFCGDGPLRSDLESAAGPEAVFLGQLDYEEMPSVYRAADALVLPSRAEGTPRTVLESLACETPVACSDLPHVRDAFGDRVRYFPPGDVDAIADRLASSLDGAAPPALPAKFSWQTTVEETTTALEKICETDGRSQ